MHELAISQQSVQDLSEQLEQANVSGSAGGNHVLAMVEVPLIEALLRVMTINADLTRRRVNMIRVWSDASGDHAELPKGTGRQPKRATRK